VFDLATLVGPLYNCGSAFLYDSFTLLHLSTLPFPRLDWASSPLMLFKRTLALWPSIGQSQSCLFGIVKKTHNDMDFAAEADEHASSFFAPLSNL